MGAQVAGAQSPVVSVIVVNYRGTRDTVTCLRAVRDEIDYPGRVEIICVDNDSGDGGAEEIAAAVPEATLVRAGSNLGFAGGCNLGARRATGSVLAFLNNDARPDPAWISAAVGVLRGDPTIGAVAGKVLDWDGALIDFVDAGLTWYGMGYQRFAGQPDDGSHDDPRDVLFGQGSALFVRADLFTDLGGFDERYFMFYEDVDLGWRLNLRGWRVRYVPTAVTFHRGHASMSSVHISREYFLLERNALASLYKNVEDATLAKVLPAAMALAVRRATARGEIDPTQLEITRRPDDPSADEQPVPVSRAALAGILAIDRFVDLLPSLVESRAVEQTRRVRSDADLAGLMRKALEPAYPLPRYLAAHEILVEAFGLEEIYGRPRRIAVITGDAIGPRMAGPAIRAWHMAEALHTEHEVRLISVNKRFDPTEAPFTVLRRRPKELAVDVDWADVVVLQGHVLEMVPALKDPASTKIVVCDIYDPMHLESLEQGKHDDDDRRAADLRGVTQVLNTQLTRGDFLLCASARQRHLWLGHLAALGRLTPELYDADPTTRSLLAEAPFGLPGTPARRTGPGPRTTIDAIGADDKLVLWAGGIYNWFDPLTLIRAIDLLRADHPDVRLCFLGMRHPNPDVPAMEIGRRTTVLADELGLTDKFVFFNHEWVPYHQRQNWLLDADCGVTTHHEHVETTFAFRTRVLDYLWTGLPIVTTDGDSFADLVRDRELGVVVPESDPRALAEALGRVLYEPGFASACAGRIAEVRESFTWAVTLKPLVDFCRRPRPAADRLRGRRSPLVRPAPISRARAVVRDLNLIREYLGAGGPAEVARRAVGRLRRLTGRTR